MARRILLDVLAEICEDLGMDELFTFVREGIAKERGRWPALARESGVSYSWITKFGAGKYDQTNVGHRTLERVAEVLRQKESRAA